jgi:cell division septal protein FtsQ
LKQQHNRETGERKTRERERERLTERDRTAEEEKWAMVDGDGGRRKWLGRRLLYPLFVFFLLIIFFLGVLIWEWIVVVMSFNGGF